VFTYAERRLGIPFGSIKATVLIETVLAAFEMDEILYELRHHAAGLNCGRWDYIFSFIKKFQRHPEFLFPDRAQVTMTRPFMRAYTQLAIRTCHRRGAHCIGGMAAQIPVKDDPDANAKALEQVRLDKVREASDGHDGTWVAHPGLVPVAMRAFDERMPTPNQIHRLREDVVVTAADLLAVPEGAITEQGLRNNISVAVQYIEAWLRGVGAVPIFNLMEDAATAEIARAQVWQWIHHPQGVLQDGRKVTLALVKELLDEELAKLREQVGEERFRSGPYQRAVDLFLELTSADECAEFFTTKAYESLD
jgi:malate synthase